MMRSWMTAVVLSLLLSVSARAQHAEAPASAAGPGIISYGHDPNCPGCRAFLAGYGGACDHSPGCTACDAGAGAGTGAGEGLGPEAESALGTELLAADFGTGFGYEYAVPGMIGDFFGGTSQMLVGSSGQGGSNFFGSPSLPNPDARTNVAAAGGDRRFKIAENYSPYPLDRFFVNYNNFHNALRTADGRNANLNRFVLGAEKTFFDQMTSIEVRLPMNGGLNATQLVDPLANDVAYEFGNIALAFKGLLWRTNTVAVSAGMGLVLPTASDSHLIAAPSVAGSIPGHSTGDMVEVMTLHNDAYYVQPFIGFWYTPNERFFAQLAGQLDFDAKGNQVDLLNRAGVLTKAGVLQDQTLMFLDASFGYWLFHNPYGDGVITGMAPMVELHYSTTVQDTDLVDAGFLGRPFNIDRVTNLNGRMDILNLTGAMRLEVAGQAYVTIFGVAPLRTAEEKLFDAEFGVQYTRRF